MKKIISIIVFLSIYSGCEKFKNETDPRKIILGKWETIEMGNGSNMEVVEPVGYREFLSDSILIEYSYQTQQFKNKKYWIDSLLYECFLFQNSHKCVMTWRYTYEFFDKNNKLRIEYKDMMALYNIFILKRKK